MKCKYFHTVGGCKFDKTTCRNLHEGKEYSSVYNLNYVTAIPTVVKKCFTCEQELFLPKTYKYCPNCYHNQEHEKDNKDFKENTDFIIHIADDGEDSE